MTLHNGVSFGCCSIREAPIYQVFLFFQSLSSGWKLEITATKFLKPPCAVRSVVLPRPNASLISRAVSAALWPRLN